MPTLLTSHSGRLRDPILGLPAWGVKQGYGSFLSFEFGEPALQIKERKTEREGLKRSTTVYGQWHLWIYCCNWRILRNGRPAAWSEDNREIIERAAHYLNGQKLFSIDANVQEGRSNFRFDLGGELQTWPYDDDKTSEQWMWFSGAEVFTYRADGRYKLGPSNAGDDAGAWLSLR